MKQKFLSDKKCRSILNFLSNDRVFLQDFESYTENTDFSKFIGQYVEKSFRSSSRKFYNFEFHCYRNEAKILTITVDYIAGNPETSAQ